MPHEVDIIVVGSGSGGAPVARRLVDAGWQVAVLEAGRDPLGAEEVEDPSKWFSLQQGEWDWGHSYLPSDRLLGRTVPIPRGFALGGSSATNAMMWYRGTPADYARWDAVAPGWSFADCLPAFRACEAWEDGATELRGGDGPLKISHSNTEHPLTQAMIAGALEMGLPQSADANGPEPLGVGLANFNIHEGKRFTSADGYLRPVSGGDGLTILTEARVAEVLFTGDRATGVAYIKDGVRHEMSARKGVVLAAGAIETPRLLMLSGIGPEAELARLGLPCRVKAEAVGQDFQDHPLLRAINIRSKQPVGAMTGNGGGTLTIWKSNPTLNEADVLAFPIQNRSGVPAVFDSYDLSGEVFAIGTGVMRAYSKGYMRLTGAGLSDPLEIEPNLLADPRDLKALISAVDFLLDMVQTEGFAPLFAGFAAPEKRVRGAELETFVRRACSTFFHCSGTARMGADPDAVTDPRLRVNGVDGLWIADASVIPEIPACHTHAPVTMIGERAAHFILEDA